MLTPGYMFAIPQLLTVLTGASMLVLVLGTGAMDAHKRIMAIVSLLCVVDAGASVASKTASMIGVPFSLPGVVTLVKLFIPPLSVCLLQAAGRGRAMCTWQAVLVAATAVFISLSAGNALNPADTAPWFAVVILAGSVAPVVPGYLRGGGGPEKGLGPVRIVTVAGVVSLAALSALDFFVEWPIPPMGFAFVGLIMAAVGLLLEGVNEEERVANQVRLVTALLVASFFLAVSAVLLLALTTPVTTGLSDTPVHLLWFAASSVASFFLCGACAAIIAKASKRSLVDAALLSAGALMGAILNLRDIMGVFYQGNLREIYLLNDLLLALSPGVVLHLAERFTRKTPGREVIAFYAAGAVSAAVIMAESTTSLGPVVFGRGIGQYLFLGSLTAALSRSLWIVGAFAKAREVGAEKVNARYFLGGYAALGLIVLVSMITEVRFGLSAYFLAWVPLGVVSWSVLAGAERGLGFSMGRHIPALAIRAAVSTIYVAAVAASYALLKGYPAEFILERLVPYGVPPLLSFLCAAFLSLYVLVLERNRPESVPFSLICFCYAMLNLDITLVGIVPDREVALEISRVDHFFLVLVMLGANFHLMFKVIGRKKGWYLVWGAYVFGACMAPLTQTNWYFDGMHAYYWGYFAKKAVLYDFMSALWLVGTLYAAYVMFVKFRGQKAAGRRTMRNVISAFIFLAFMSLTNTPAIYGYEIYPLGTFVFVPLVCLAYSLFKYNLSMALQHLRSVLFFTGTTVVLAGIAMAPVVALGLSRSSLVAGVVLASLLNAPVRKGLDEVLSLFIPKASDRIHERYRLLTSNLTRVLRLEDLNRHVASWMFETFRTTFVTSVFPGEGTDVGAAWTITNNEGMHRGLFGYTEEDPFSGCLGSPAADERLLALCSEGRGVFSRDDLAGDARSAAGGFTDNRTIREVEIFMPVHSHGRLTAVFLLGPKVDGSRYSRLEREVLTDLAVSLGPQVENARLLENLEQEVEKRTGELNEALVEAMIKEREVAERNALIERQNRISEVLLETSTRMHQAKSLDDLFGFTLMQLKSLFEDLKGGIVMVEKGSGIIDASAFVGLTEREQKLVMESVSAQGGPGFEGILAGKAERDVEGADKDAHSQWKVFPLNRPGDRVMGYLILEGKDIHGPSERTVSLFVSLLSAVVQNRLLMADLEKMASTDGLTGVYNRAFLDRELEKSVKHAKRFKDMWFSVLIVDVNGLKQINDTYGHAAGDKLIVEVASMLKSVCRETDVVARIGGDEFAVLMPSTNRVQAQILLKRIREAQADLNVVVSPSVGVHLSIPVRISIGLASSDEDDPELVMKIADDLMYADKQRFYAEAGVAARIAR